MFARLNSSRCRVKSFHVTVQAKQKCNFFVFSFSFSVLCAKNLVKKDFFRKYLVSSSSLWGAGGVQFISVQWLHQVRPAVPSYTLASTFQQGSSLFDTGMWLQADVYVCVCVLQAAWRGRFILILIFFGGQPFAGFLQCSGKEAMLSHVLGVFGCVWLGLSWWMSTLRSSARSGALCGAHSCHSNAQELSKHSVRVCVCV